MNKLKYYYYPSIWFSVTRVNKRSTAMLIRWKNKDKDKDRCEKSSNQKSSSSTSAKKKRKFGREGGNLMFVVVVVFIASSHQDLRTLRKVSEIHRYAIILFFFAWHGLNLRNWMFSRWLCLIWVEVFALLWSSGKQCRILDLKKHHFTPSENGCK